jgi:hypothetical protein
VKTMTLKRPKARGGVYRSVHIRVWLDEKFQKLTAAQPNAQTLWFYLLFGDQTGIVPGLFKAGEGSLAEALGWPLQAMRDAYSEVMSLGMVRADWKARLVFVPKAVEYNPPASLNVVKSWANAIRDLPECELRTRAIQHIQSALERMQGKSQAFAEAFAHAISHDIPLRNQEQNQKNTNSARKKSRDKGVNPSDVHDFERAWKLYPKREGDNPAKRARSAWNASIKRGVNAKDMIAGVERYRHYVEQKHIEGTILVMQTVRFFGPDESWKNEWTVAPSAAENRGLQSAAYEDAGEALRKIREGAET